MKMDYNLVELVIALINNLFVILTIIFVLGAIIRISKKKEDTKVKRIVFKFFLFMGIGYLLYSAAEIWWNFVAFVQEGNPAFRLFEGFWVVGACVMFFSFLYFSIAVYREKGTLLRGLFIIFISSLSVAVLTYYWIVRYAYTGIGVDSTSWEIFLLYFYPISSSLILIASINVYSFFREFESLGTPLLFLAFSSLSFFFADMLYLYVQSIESYNLIYALDDGIYALAYLFSAVSFGLVCRCFILRHLFDAGRQRAVQ